MAQGDPCVSCGRVDRPIMAWKGEEVCSERCRKERDETPPPARCTCGDMPPGSIRSCPLHAAQAGSYRLAAGQPVGGVLGHPFWLVEISSERPTNHTPCWAGVEEITGFGDEVEWFKCLKCGATKSGKRIGHEAGEH